MSTEAPRKEHLVLRETPCLACLSYLSSFTPGDGEPVSCCDDMSESESQGKALGLMDAIHNAVGLDVARY